MAEGADLAAEEATEQEMETKQDRKARKRAKKEKRKVTRDRPIPISTTRIEYQFMPGDQSHVRKVSLKMNR